ncbi:YqjF family protein [Paenibacillus sp. S-38]|uniref:YqjF family protein n=1 Tax=Paenibacillus sp. S-38 TaxID=3416710 RepID=UPI003CEBB3E3
MDDGIKMKAPLERESNNEDIVWVMKQRWLDLLFAHWPLSPAGLQDCLPPGLTLDTYGGEAWMGVVPFRMKGIRARWLPPIPGGSAFPELNVRTYVRVGGRAGVYFFSLDTSHALAAALARRFYRLPYFRAQMSVESGLEDGWVRYASRRSRGSGAGETAFSAVYRPVSTPFLATPGSLAHWLTERYSLFTMDGKGEVLRCDIRHEPWKLQMAEVRIAENTMTTGQGLPLLLEGKPLVHYALEREVEIGWIRPAAEYGNEEA